MFKRIEYEALPPIFDKLPNNSGFRIYLDVEEKQVERPVMTAGLEDNASNETETVTVYYCHYIDVPKLRYKDIIERIIRNEYSISDELAILRQKDAKPDEFNEYYEFTEKAKSIAKKAMNIG